MMKKRIECAMHILAEKKLLTEKKERTKGRKTLIFVKTVKKFIQYRRYDLTGGGR